MPKCHDEVDNNDCYGSILTCVEIKESGILNWKTVQSHQEDTDDSYRQP
jgi:hypothetical protein